MKKEEYITKLEKAIDYVESNLDKPISLSSVSLHAFSSLSHFHRIFYFMTGFTLKEYIRRRRLSNAAMQLISSKKSVIDMALDAQFESPESFNRSFKKMFGLSPTIFRNRKPEFQIMRRIDINSMMHELKQPANITMNFVYLYQQIIIGLKTRTTLENSQQTTDIPKFFEEVMEKNLLANILHVSDHQKIFGVYSDMSNEEEFDYTVGLSVAKPCDDLQKYSCHLLPMAEYARFSVQGDASKLENAWRYIYGSWMPNSGCSRLKGLDFEIYFPEKTDIYIPILPDK